MGRKRGVWVGVGTVGGGVEYFLQKLTALYFFTPILMINDSLTWGGGGGGGQYLLQSAAYENIFHKTCRRKNILLMQINSIILVNL